METIKRQAGTVLVVSLAVKLARVCGTGLQSIGCTSALACVVPAPLKSRYVTDLRRYTSVICLCLYFRQLKWYERVVSELGGCFQPWDVMHSTVASDSMSVDDKFRWSQLSAADIVKHCQSEVTVQSVSLSAVLFELLCI